MMKKFEIALVLALTILISSALAPAQTKRGKPAPAKPVVRTVALSAAEIAESGGFTDEVYKNRLLGFSVAIPEGWNVISDEVNKAGMDAAKERTTANKSAQFAKAADKSIANTRVLFQAYSYSPEDYKMVGVLGCGIESSAGTLAQYTEFNKKLVLSTHKDSKLIKDTYKKTMAGTVFNAFEVEIPKVDGKLGQTYFVTSRRNVMFFFVLTYTNDTGKKLMEKSLATLTLDKTR